MFKKIYNRFEPGPLGRKFGDFIVQRSAPFEKTVVSEFPTTRFYGSKRKQLGWLAEEFSRLNVRTALDAFGGTGAVSFLMDALGWEVTYNDIFEFNSISAKAIFSDSTLKFKKNHLIDFLEKVELRAGFISATFDELYFTKEENSWLDGIMYEISLLDESPRNLILYLVFQACLKKRPFNLFHRANLHLRTSSMPVKFGNRTTWNKTFSSHIISAYEELQISQSAKVPSICVNEAGCAKNVNGSFDLVYLDPPYFKLKKRNTDTYLQRYHFLEGLARFNEWGSLIDYSLPQRSLRSPYRGELTNKYELVADLKEMFINHPNSKFALSYVSGEAPKEEELFDLFRGQFDKVRLSRRNYNKVLSNKSSAEILIIGQ